MPIQTLSEMMTGTVRSLGRGGRSFEERRESLRVDQALRGLERMKIGIGDADVPGDEAMRADLDAFLRHDERAVQEREIADRARAVLAEGERAAGVTGDVIAEDARRAGALLCRWRKICAVSQ